VSFDCALRIEDCGTKGANRGIVGADFFLWVTSVKLFRRRKGALRLAWWLLALETVGAALLLGAADYTSMREFELSAALVFVSIILVAWTLPNALAFYKARSLFTEPAKEKPGL
jgi:hypothetical protein